MMVLIPDNWAAMLTRIANRNARVNGVELDRTDKRMGGSDDRLA